MRKFLNKIIIFTLTFALLLSSVGNISALAQIQKENGELNVSVTVKERNGIFVKDFFFRRGIALEEGLVYNTEEVCIKENGSIIPSAAEATERYEDGSIRWLLVSAKMDLKPNELKNLTVTNGKYDGSGTAIEEDSNSIRVRTDRLCVTANTGGVTSIIWDGKEMLNNNPINLYAIIEGVTHYMRASEVTVLKDTASYKKLKLKGFIADGLEGEMYVTVADNASGVHIEHRHHFYEQITVQSMGIIVGEKYSGTEVGKVINEDYLDLGSMQLSSYENTRFNNAVCDPTLTGYVIEEDRVLFAPLIHKASFKWADGASRTMHLHINFINSSKEYAKTLSLPPSVKVDAEQYKKGGQIKTTDQNILLKQAVETVKHSYKKSVRKLAAGALCSDADIQLNKGTPGVSSGGDVEYNLGMGYMLTGDEEVYRHMVDLSEARADLAVYKGSKADVIGCVRTHLFSTFSDNSAFHNHGYYSDEGGMYMTYMLSGNEYVGEMFELAVEKTMKDMYVKTGNGGRGPVVTYWQDRATNPNGNTSYADFMEARGMIRARTMYLASRYFHDDRYRQTAYDIVKWAINCQESFGGFNQVYWNNGMKYYLTTPDRPNEPYLPFKDYTMLYGFRGINQLLDWEVDEDTLGLVCRVADYLCSHYERFGPFLMQPNSDIELTAYDETGGRRTSAVTTLLALDVICSAYEHTKNERYFEAICAFTEELFCITIDGWALGPAPTKGDGTGETTPDGQRSVSILRTVDDLSVIFKENRDRLKEMGYESLYVAFTEDTKVADDAVVNVKHPHVTQNVYESSEGKVLFLSNNSTELKSYTEGWDRDIEARFDENKLWQGANNAVELNSSVTLEKFLEHKDRIIALQRPICVEEIEGKANINIDTYKEDEITLTLSGDFEIALNFENGLFPINDNTGYSVVINKEKDASLKMTIKPGGEEKAKDGVITVKLNGNGQRVGTVGTRVLALYQLDNFDNDAPISGNKLSKVIKQAFNQEVTFNEEYPSWNSFAKEFIGAAAANNSTFFDEVGIHTVIDGNYSRSISDEEAVKYAAEALDIVYESEGLASDVYLAKKGLYGTDISWVSEREDILSTEGVITRRNIDCEKITMTATVTRGVASVEKKITIPLEKPVAPPMVASGDFGESTKNALVPQTGTCEFTFDVRVNRDYTDTIIFLSSSKVPVTAVAGQGYLVRFAPKKKKSSDDYYPIDTRDGAAFYVKNPAYYKAGDLFHFRLVVRLDEQTYDAYVTPDGGEEIVLGENMKPRATATAIYEIDQINVWGGNAEAVTISNIKHADYAKESAVNVMISDDSGNLYDPYASLDSFVLPALSKKGNLINWQTVNSNVLRYGSGVRVRIGVESIKPENQDITQALQTVRMLEKGISGEDSVTATSLTRILSVISRQSR